MIDQNPPTETRIFFKIFGSEVVLGTLVALLSILTAGAAYMGSLADAQSSEKNVEGQKQLTEANEMYVEANQFVIYDYTMYNGWITNQDTNPSIADYYQAGFSDDLVAAIKLNYQDPFNDQYYSEMYKDANATYDESQAYFDEAQAAGDRATNLQLVVMVFAVGLALVAYGSLMDAGKSIRIVFAIGSIAALLFGVFAGIIYLTR
jgi:hypothetical protein